MPSGYIHTYDPILRIFWTESASEAVGGETASYSQFD